jgi:hypothetical protein
VRLGRNDSLDFRDSVEPAARRAERNPGMSQKTENLNAPATTKPWRHSPKSAKTRPSRRSPLNTLPNVQAQ